MGLPSPHIIETTFKTTFKVLFIATWNIKKKLD